MRHTLLVYTHQYHRGHSVRFIISHTKCNLHPPTPRRRFSFFFFFINCLFLLACLYCVYIYLCTRSSCANYGGDRGSRKPAIQFHPIRSTIQAQNNASTRTQILTKNATNHTRILLCL